MMFVPAFNLIFRNPPRRMVWITMWAGISVCVLVSSYMQPQPVDSRRISAAVGATTPVASESIQKILVPLSSKASQDDPADALNEPAWLNDAIRFIERFEGRRHRAYRDTTGHPTIGVGFNLDRNGAAEDIRRLLPDLSYRALRRGTQVLTDEQIDRLLRHDVLRAIRTARSQFQGFDDLPIEIRLILVDMTFNTGSLHTWRNLRSAINRRDYDAAADAMYHSLWRRQTGRRARHHIALMRSLAHP